MIKEKMAKALNRQLNRELYSSYLYLSMSAWFETAGLKGFAHWMRVQAKEELGHAMKFYRHIVDSSSRITLASIETPPAEWNSPLAVFEDVYKHEQKVTEMINNLVAMSVSEQEESTNNFLQWFVKEQKEEEESADRIVQRLKIAGGDQQSIKAIDQELGKRKD